ncbi:UNVERIFIED_CONTAM: hypothetical protein FKN15_067849 [Acipenser sinensis]
MRARVPMTSEALSCLLPCGTLLGSPRGFRTQKFRSAKTAVDDEEEVEYANIEDSIEPEEKTPISKKPLAEELKPQATTKSNACGAKSIVVLYILLIGSSAVWMALFSRAFAKLCIKTCPCEWISFNGECYYFSKERADWHKAKEYCNSKNASLAVISSDQELIKCFFIPAAIWLVVRLKQHRNRNIHCGSETLFHQPSCIVSRSTRVKAFDPHPEVGRWDPGQPGYGPAKDDDNEDEYENIEDSIELEEVKTNQTEAFKEKSKAQAAQDHNVCGTRSIVFLYVLLIASSVMWAALLSLLFVKYSQLSSNVRNLEKDISSLKTKGENLEHYKDLPSMKTSSQKFYRLDF